MLSYAETAELSMAICATAETLGQTLSAPAAKLMAEDLADHPMGVIANALWSCRREVTGKLTLAARCARSWRCLIGLTRICVPDCSPP